MKHKIPEIIINICKKLNENGFEAYIVGGSIRDVYLGKIPQDWDIATNATPDDICRIFPRHFYENKYGTVGVVPYETDIDLNTIPPELKVVEITPYRIEGKYSDGRRPDSVKFVSNIDEDLKRRDFTCNALAYDPIKDILKDNFNSIKDINDKVIKTVGNPEERFSEDNLRLLRAVRLACSLDFSVSRETLESIKNNSYKIKNISRERIRYELIKLFMCNTPMLGFLTLEYTGLLEDIIPELRKGIGLGQTQAHKYDVWGHLLRSMQAAADKGYHLELRIAALFHDIGKPYTAKIDENTKQNTFYGHEVVGERVTREILTRLMFSQKQIEYVSKLVRWHMFFSDPEQVTLSAVRRLIANVGKENIWDLMNLRICDRIGTGRPKEDPYRLRKFHAMIDQVLNDPVDLSMLKIDGNKIMQVSHEKAGRRIGYILNALMGKVFDDPSLNTEEKLVELVGELSKLNDEALIKLAEYGKGELQNKKEEELVKIQKKHRL